MLLRCVFSEDDIMLPHIFELGLRLNSNIYLKLVETVEICSWKTIYVTAGFDSLLYLKQKSEVVVREFL